MPFTTKNVAAYFHRSEATVRNWAEEFASYLSPTGAPEVGKTRQFTVEDMKVFDLVSKLKDQRRTYEEIHTTLAAGGRGEAPSLDEKDLRVLSATEGERRVALEVEALQRAILGLQAQLKVAQETAAEVGQIRLQNARLETKLEMTEDQLARSQQEVEALRDQISTLSQELQRLAAERGEASGHGYSRGVLETLRQLGKLPADEE